MKNILPFTTNLVPSWLSKFKVISRKTMWFLSRLVLWGVVWLAIKFVFLIWQRYDTREIISYVAFPHFKEASWWDVSVSKYGMFGAYRNYEAKLMLPSENLNKIVTNGYEKFDMRLASRGTDVADSETLGKRWHEQHRLFAAPPQLGSRLPLRNYRPAFDFTHDEIYYKINDIEEKHTFAIMINATSGFVWVYIGPI